MALGLLAATAALAAPVVAGSAPGDGCVPGTVWEDRATGITYICIYDELYGGTRWDILPSKQAHSESSLYRSSSLGCVLGLTATGGYGGTSGGNILVRSSRWPCTSIHDRMYQPAGELRARAVIQRYASGVWTTCRDSGYQVNTVTTDRWIGGVGMGTYADCGAGQYRTLGFGAMYQGAAWRGATLLSPSLWLR